MKPTHSLRAEDRKKSYEFSESPPSVMLLHSNLTEEAITLFQILSEAASPVGGFKIRKGLNYVTLTAYLSDLLDLPHGYRPSIEEWTFIFESLTAEPAEGHENVYGFASRANGKFCWLRVTQTETDWGRVGSIFDVTEDVERNRHLARKLDYDPLTGLYNRIAFKRRVHEIIAHRPQEVGAMIFADIDNLKHINDTYGHELGDRYLIAAANAFSRFDDYDGIVSRISGDEFAIYLHGYQSREEVFQVVLEQFENFRQAGGDPQNERPEKISCSAGVAFYPSDSQDMADLLKLADFAMYEAKHNGKGKLFEFGGAFH